MNLARVVRWLYPPLPPLRLDEASVREVARQVARELGAVGRPLEIQIESMPELSAAEVAAISGVVREALAEARAT